MDAQSFKRYLSEQTYDKYYQDIEIIRLEGYAKSHLSWENIKDLVDWKNKIVLDVGCFHGYFCFKAEQAGARLVTGIDKNADTLITTQMIADASKSNCKFFNIDIRDIEPHVDILLCMNVFHHIPDKDGFLRKLEPGQKMIMEIDKENLPKIQEYCNVLKIKPSHRPSAYTGDTPNRLVLLVEKA